jgi:2-oxoglutarate ferredoxin oxidoreductase subunit alpha
MQMEDEIASLAAVIGASLAGRKAFTATSGPGFSLMQENLGVAIVGEVPCVVVDVQRVGPSTGLANRPGQSDFMQVRWGRHGDQTIVALSPASVRECFTLTAAAFNLAEKFRTPVVLLADEIVGHMRENFTLPAPGELAVIGRAQPSAPPDQYLPFDFAADQPPPLAAYGGKYVFHVTSSMHDEAGASCHDPANAARRISQLHRKLEANRGQIVMTNAEGVEDCEILVVAAGAVARAARAAVRQARQSGIAAGALQLVTIWPFPGEEIAAAARRAKMIVVAEMNFSGQLAGEVRRAVGGALEVRGVNSYNGEIITPRQIMQAMR